MSIARYLEAAAQGASAPQAKDNCNIIVNNEYVIKATVSESENGNVVLNTSEKDFALLVEAEVIPSDLVFFNAKSEKAHVVIWKMVDNGKIDVEWHGDTMAVSPKDFGRIQEALSDVGLSHEIEEVNDTDPEHEMGSVEDVTDDLDETTNNDEYVIYIKKADKDNMDEWLDSEGLGYESIEDAGPDHYKVIFTDHISYQYGFDCADPDFVPEEINKHATENEPEVEESLVSEPYSHPDIEADALVSPGRESFDTMRLKKLAGNLPAGAKPMTIKGYNDEPKREVDEDWGSSDTTVLMRAMWQYIDQQAGGKVNPETIEAAAEDAVPFWAEDMGYADDPEGAVASAIGYFLRREDGIKKVRDDVANDVEPQVQGEIIDEEIVEPVVAVHPDYEMSEYAGCLITDVHNMNEFAARWEDQDNEMQEEFGWDLPLWDANNTESGPPPRRKIKMTFDEYCKLVIEYLGTQTDESIGDITRLAKGGHRDPKPWERTSHLPMKDRFAQHDEGAAGGDYVSEGKLRTGDTVHLAGGKKSKIVKCEKDNKYTLANGKIVDGSEIKKVDVSEGAGLNKLKKMKKSFNQYAKGIKRGKQDPMADKGVGKKIDNEKKGLTVKKDIDEGKKKDKTNLNCPACKQPASAHKGLSCPVKKAKERARQLKPGSPGIFPTQSDVNKGIAKGTKEQQKKKVKEDRQSFTSENNSGIKVYVKHPTTGQLYEVDMAKTGAKVFKGQPVATKTAGWNCSVWSNKPVAMMLRNKK